MLGLVWGLLMAGESDNGSEQQLCERWEVAGLKVMEANVLLLSLEEVCKHGCSFCVSLRRVLALPLGMAACGQQTPVTHSACEGSSSQQPIQQPRPPAAVQVMPASTTRHSSSMQLAAACLPPLQRRRDCGGPWALPRRHHSQQQPLQEVQGLQGVTERGRWCRHCGIYRQPLTRVQTGEQRHGASSQQLGIHRTHRPTCMVDCLEVHSQIPRAVRF